MALGPMSTPRRSAPRSIGTPSKLIRMTRGSSTMHRATTAKPLPVPPVARARAYYAADTSPCAAGPVEGAERDELRPHLSCLQPQRRQNPLHFVGAAKVGRGAHRHQPLSAAGVTQVGLIPARAAHERATRRRSP